MAGRQEVGHAPQRRLRPDDSHEGQLRHQPHRHEVALPVIGQGGPHGGVDDQRGRRRKQGMPVGRRRGHGLRAEHRPASPAIFHHHAVLQGPPERVGEEPRDGVHPAARREGHDQGHRTARIGGLAESRRETRCCERGRAREGGTAGERSRGHGRHLHGRWGADRSSPSHIPPGPPRKETRTAAVLTGWPLSRRVGSAWRRRHCGTAARRSAPTGGCRVARARRAAVRGRRSGDGRGPGRRR